MDGIATSGFEAIKLNGHHLFQSQGPRSNLQSLFGEGPATFDVATMIWLALWASTDFLGDGVWELQGLTH